MSQNCLYLSTVDEYCDRPFLRYKERRNGQTNGRTQRSAASSWDGHAVMLMDIRSKLALVRVYRTDSYNNQYIHHQLDCDLRNLVAFERHGFESR